MNMARSAFRMSLFFSSVLVCYLLLLQLVLALGGLHRRSWKMETHSPRITERPSITTAATAASYTRYELKSRPGGIYSSHGTGWELADIPVIGRIGSRQGRYGQSINDFYKKYELASQVNATIRAAAKTGDMELVKELREKYKDELSNYNRYKIVAQKISDARKRGADEDIITRLARLALGRS